MVQMLFKPLRCVVGLEQGICTAVIKPNFVVMLHNDMLSDLATPTCGVAGNVQGLVT